MRIAHFASAQHGSRHHTTRATTRSERRRRSAACGRSGAGPVTLCTSRAPPGARTLPPARRGVAGRGPASRVVSLRLRRPHHARGAVEHKALLHEALVRAAPHLDVPPRGLVGDEARGEQRGVAIAGGRAGVRHEGRRERRRPEEARRGARLVVRAAGRAVVRRRPAEGRMCAIQRGRWWRRVHMNAFGYACDINGAASVHAYSTTELIAARVHSARTCTHADALFIGLTRRAAPRLSRVATILLRPVVLLSRPRPGWRQEAPSLQRPGRRVGARVRSAGGTRRRRVPGWSLRVLPPELWCRLCIGPCGHAAPC